MTDNKQASAGPNHSHAWRGTWDRPMNIDENSTDALTVARMTDHNVRGTDEPQLTAPESTAIERVTARSSDEDGHYDVDGVSLAERKELQVIVASDADHDGS